MRSVTEVADAYVEQLAAVDPVRASRTMGIGRRSPELTDYSPDGQAAIAGVLRSTLDALARAEPADEVERLGKAYLEDACAAQLAVHDAGETQRFVSALAGPPSMVRMAFDVMPAATDDDWATIAARLDAVSAAMAGYRSSLATTATADPSSIASPRVIEAVAEQCEAWAGGWFAELAAGYAGEHASLRQRLEGAAARAAAAYGDLARWLRDDLLRRAPATDGVGAERYRLWSRQMLGTELDLDEAYAWAVDELDRLEDEKRRECEQILPGAPAGEVYAHLEAGGGEVVDGVDAYRDALQAIVDEVTDALAGVEFDIPDELRTCVVGIPPAGTALAPYYSPPSEDLSQPGTTWFPTGGNERFPMWGEYTTCYHEAVPGHHLQLGGTRVLPLVRAQRVGGNVAHLEGWALYAERLMDELGWFTVPERRLGFLSMQAFRAARVVVDIGLHTGRDGWDYERAVDRIAAVSGHGRAFAESEVLRYLSWPAQATAYKLGERAWLAGRQAAMDAAGGRFDRRAWHRDALALGPLGLDRLGRELAALAERSA